MKIHLTRQGGFSGIPMEFSLDTDQLSPAESRALLDLVESAGFFSLPDKILPAHPGADRFQYVISIENAGSSHTVEIAESSLSPSLQDLIQHVTRRGR